MGAHTRRMDVMSARRNSVSDDSALAYNVAPEHQIPTCLFSRKLSSI